MSKTSLLTSVQLGLWAIIVSLGLPLNTFAALDSDTIWTADQGPYRIDENLTVPAGITLAIMEGTEITLGPNVQIIVQGRLVAQGTKVAPIHFTRHPESTEPWGGLQFKDTQTDNELVYCVLEYGQTNDGEIGLDNSRLHLDHVTLDHTARRRIRTINSSLLVENCLFTDMFGPNEPPLTDNYSEHIWGSGVPEDGYFIIRNNVFGTVKGHNDAIDFDGPSRPHPIPQFLNNVFLGGGDDALDLESDAHIEGNLFMNIIKDQYNHSSGESNALSSGAGRDYVMVRNIFKHVQHAAQVKDGAFLTFVNNTVVDASGAAIYFDLDLPGRGPGRGAFIDGSIFWDTPDVLEGVVESTDLTINHSLIPTSWHIYGQGNYDADPLLVSVDQNDFNLQPDSIAIGTGSCGLDMGAMVPAGAAVSGEPEAVTSDTTVTLTVGGPGIVAYQYSVNEPNGPWSAVADVNQPLVLSDLIDGASYRVYVRGQNTAAAWQEVPTVSRTWMVDTHFTSLTINEFLADNVTAVEHEGTFPDIIELAYQGPAPLDLAGMSISDNPTHPDKYVFPIGTVIQPNAKLVLWADSNALTSGLHLGFGLDNDGEGIYLYNASGAIIDQVQFGRQIPDASVGRFGPDGTWRLTRPTPGSENVPMALGDHATLKLNEWLAQGEVLVDHDFIELYNSQPDPVNLAGLSLTNDPLGVTHSPAFAPLSFIAGSGYALLKADGQDGAGHVNFTLPSSQGLLGLLDQDQQVIDEITYGSQFADVSEGREPDGSDIIKALALPTPGAPNPGVGETVTSDVILLAQSDEKTAWIPTDANMYATAWASDPNFDDSQWLVSTGEPGGVGYENGSGYENLISLNVIDMRLNVTSCYIRSPFDLNAAQLSGLQSLQLKIHYDDGFIAYLNGVEVARRNFNGSPAWNSNASSNHESGAGDFDLTLDLSEFMDLLVEGRNLLAIHGLNVNLTSSDFIISTQLEGTLTQTLPGQDYAREQALLSGLRISELMYHAPEGSDFDYVELKNISDSPIDVNGVRFTNGINYVLPALEMASGQTVVVAADPALFQSLYGSDMTVLGPYKGKLNNSGESVTLSLPVPLDVAILRFAYHDTWYPVTDGQGQSLTIRDSAAPVETWNQAAAWEATEPSPGL